MKKSIIIIMYLLIQACTVVEKDERLLVEHKCNTGEKRVYYIATGATTNEVIQVRNSSKDKPVWVSEEYNYLISSRLVNDTALQLVLGDTGRYNNGKPDTLLIQVNTEPRVRK